MSEKQNHRLPHEEEIVEIELGAEELRRLTQARSLPARGPRRWRSAAAIAGVGSVLALAAIVGYRHLGSAAVPAAPAPPPLVAQIEEPPPAAAPASDQPPVRVRNPFDKSEVFEFPPGTSPEVARAAVADTLLERARGRQAEYDARHARKRRARPG